MTFLAINWLNISINLLMVIFVIVCLLMTLVILMQRPKQEGLGAAFGGGVTDQVFGARTTNVLQRGTVYLGSLFFILSLTLAVLFGQKNKTYSIGKDSVTAPAAEAAPAVPAAPASLVDELPVEAAPPADTTTPVETPADAPVETTPSVEPAPAPPSESSTEEAPSAPAAPEQSAPAENATQEDKPEGQ